MNSSLFKLFCLLLVTLLSLTGCNAQSDVSSVSTDSENTLTLLSSDASKPQINTSSKVSLHTEKTSSHLVSATSKPQNNVSSKVSSRIASDSSKQQSKTSSKTSSPKKNSSSSKKAQSSTSSKTTIPPNVEEKPVYSYSSLEKAAEEFLRKNSKFSAPAEPAYYYDLEENFCIIPRDFLEIIGAQCTMDTIISGEKEYIKNISLCQYKNHTYSSKVLEAIKRDLKITEEFAGMKPTSFVFDDVKDNETFQNFSDIPEEYFKAFSRGSNKATNLTVYFNDDNNKETPSKMVARFSCYAGVYDGGTGARIYNYSVDFYINYNRDIPEYWG